MSDKTINTIEDELFCHEEFKEPDSTETELTNRIVHLERSNDTLLENTVNIVSQFESRMRKIQRALNYIIDNTQRWSDREISNAFTIIRDESYVGDLC